MKWLMFVTCYDTHVIRFLCFQVSLSLNKMDKFGSMLHQILTVFSQLLEIASLQEIGKCTEEILEYLRSIVLASPVATIALVHQV